MSDVSKPDKAARAATAAEAMIATSARVAAAAGPACLTRRADPQYPGRTWLAGDSWDGRAEAWDLGVGSGEVRMVVDLTLHRLPPDVAVKIAAVLAGAPGE